MGGGGEKVVCGNDSQIPISKWTTGVKPQTVLLSVVFPGWRDYMINSSGATEGDAGTVVNYAKRAK